jgi:hypothetical protein
VRERFLQEVIKGILLFTMIGNSKEGYVPRESAGAYGASTVAACRQDPPSITSSGSYQPVLVANAYPVQNAIPVAQPVQYAQAPTVAAVVISSTPRGDQGWYDRNPRRIVCQYCGFEVITSVHRSPGLGVWLWAFILLFVGCWPCCLIPFCVDDCQDATHYCPNCRRPVGEKRSF